MTVASTPTVAGPFTGTGASATLPFAFKCFASTDLIVEANAAILVYGSDYTVTLNADQENSPGGTITVSATANVLGVPVYIGLNMALSQPSSFPSQSAWSPKVVEKAFDRVTLLIKQLTGLGYSAVVAPLGETLGILPTKAARVGKYFAFDANGDPITSSGTGNDSALRTDIAATGGAALIGKTGGGSVQSYINNPGSVGPITASFSAPVFTNVSFYSSAQYITNGATPGSWYSTLQGGNQATEALTSAVIVPAAATNHQTNAISAYIRADRAQPGSGGDVAAYHQAVSNANNAAVFPINALAADTIGKTGQILGNELDFNVSAADTNVNGVNATIVSVSGSALAGTRIAFAARGVFSANSQWSIGYYTADGGVAQYAISVGAVSATAATNRDSQPIALTSYNSSDVRFIATIIGDHLGGIAVRAGGASGSIAFQDPTGSLNWAAVSATGLGYAVTAGGAATQLSTKGTTVLLNKVCGQITLNNAILAANTIVSFTLTNNTIAADDDVRVWVKSGNASVGSYRVAAEGNAAGSRTIVVENKTAGSLSEAIVLGFNVLKAVVA